MIFFKALLLLSLSLTVVNLSACAGNTTLNKVNDINAEPMQTLSKDFLLKRNPHNKTVKLLKDNNSTQTLYKKATDSETMEQAAVNFLQKYRNEFLINEPAKEFKVSSNKTDDLGFTRIKLKQQYQGIPVWQGIISIHFNREHELQIVRGEYFPTPKDIDINAGLSSDHLFQKASIINPALNQTDYTSQKLIFFIDDTTPRLAYKLQPARHAKLTSYTYILDALTGKLLNQASIIRTQF